MAQYETAKPSVHATECIGTKNNASEKVEALVVTRSFTAITTCKGRLHHLKQTLPSTVCAGFDEVIVVDYNCPDKTAQWIAQNCPTVKVVEVDNEPVFNVSRARNQGAAASSCSWLCFIDADVEISPTYLSWLRHKATPGYFYRREKPPTKKEASDFRGAYGTVACERKQFERVGKYDEVFSGWGMEDDEFLIRLLLGGCKVTPVPLKHFRKVIQHDDATRMAFYETKDKTKSYDLARLYCSAKLHVMEKVGILDVPEELRRKLFDLALTVSADWSNDKDATFLVEVSDDIINSMKKLKHDIEENVLKKMHLRQHPHSIYINQFEKMRLITKLLKRIKRVTAAR